MKDMPYYEYKKDKSKSSKELDPYVDPDPGTKEGDIETLRKKFGKHMVK